MPSTPSSNPKSASGPAPAVQRRYTAACPQCGAAVGFASLAHTHAVCSYCKATLLRQGDALQRIGQAAELFEDFSGLQLGDRGRWQGQGFSLIGRLQYEGEAGRWTEWVALLDDQTSAILAEDNGAFVWVNACPEWPNLPPAGQWALDEKYPFERQSYVVSSVQQVRLLGAEGELSKLPEASRSFELVELRSDNGQVLSVDYSQTPPALTQGQSTDLEVLGLRAAGAAGGVSGMGATGDGASESTLAVRAIECPQCGSSVTLKLALSRSVACPSCRSVVQVFPTPNGDVRVGGHFTFSTASDADAPPRSAPHIALGTVGRIDGASWQVVGFQERQGAIDEARFTWGEYLLYNTQKGFGFLVDSEEGWSWVKTTTGAPKTSGGNRTTVQYLGVSFTQQSSYTAKTLSAQGEFYWPVKKNEGSLNTDFSSGNTVLNRELSKNEVVWSIGRKLSAAEVAQSFGLKTIDLERETMRPWSGDWGAVGKAIFQGCVVVLFIVLLFRCDSSDCESRYDASSSLTREEQLAQCHQFNHSRGGRWSCSDWRDIWGDGHGSSQSSSGSWGSGSGGGHK